MADSALRGRARPVIAIVGGGASGTLTAIGLLRGGTGARVLLIDRDGRHGLGAAYSTTDPHHLLNACASRMSALPDDPGHLLRWAAGQGVPAEGADFLPRALYGRYLRATLDAAEAAAPGRLERVTGTVARIAEEPDGVRLGLAGGGTVDADLVVLATGNPAPAPQPFARCVADPWAPGALAALCDGAPVLVAGTGLTMVDVAVTVTREAPGAVVYAVSRHGLLPRAHRCPPAPPAEVVLPAGPLGLPALMRAVREAVRENGGEWRAVVDGLRHQVPGLWDGLDERDRRTFLRLVARHWEVHRHRIPPATAERVARLRAEGRLRVLAGRVRAVEEEAGGLLVRLDGAGGGAGGGGADVRVGHLVNGTGPGREAAGTPFLGSDAVRHDRFGLGLDAAPDGSVRGLDGRASRRISTLGPTLRGVRYETTAVPEIREQAAALARLVAARAAALGAGAAAGAGVPAG
ncbi:FAD/NAD(P)-binding protein [Actinomadura parmotrematis]|uniref:FAD/NAD(P)-binding protein n=1 Tax=Actinomadura parmotrematis TaxID=2864039 RepID=A0ABS7FRU7_9ACTN|nr:FAD/NAD(P)-binding protein [Actinomadura parmotrematis]MBW8483134.1 FAD/NAD(P)-binding protein [Actinomadura parmotrematis]